MSSTQPQPAGLTRHGGLVDSPRADLEREILAWMRAPDWNEDEERFDRLARGLFSLQFQRCEPYRRLCRRCGVGSGELRSWREIPPVPTGAFKELELRGFPSRATVKVFRTSGTSREQRGQLFLDTLELYEASLRPNFERHLLAGLGRGRVRMRILTPAPEEMPDSSLSHMFGCALREWGDAQSGFDIVSGTLRFDALWRALERATDEAVPILLCGTAFAWVHCLDECAARGLALALPKGSRLMETGGFKGRSRAVPRLELYRGIERTLGIPERQIVNQYGMTELGSQFYDSVLAEPRRPRRKLRPPWTRVRIVDPDTRQEVAFGEVGQLEIFDLANTGSVFAVQTADLGRRVADGFEVLGRATGAEERGCSLAADLLLETP
jgi:hypothetical protein